MTRPLALAAALCLAAPAAVGQEAPAFDLVGTWELVAAENGPPGAEIAFARLEFDGRRVRSTTVYVDADDGDLRGEIQTDRYRWSDGQLLVEDAARVTILDVVRDDDALTVRDVRRGLVLHLSAAGPPLAVPPDLLGRWHAARTLSSGGAADTRGFLFRTDGLVELTRSDGEVDVDDYVVAGPYLLVDTTAYRYAIRNGRLVIEGEGEPIELSRVHE